MQVTRNNYNNEISGRSGDDSIETEVIELMKSHDLKFKLPAVGAVTVDSQNLDKDEIDFKLDFGDEETASEGKIYKPN